MLERGDCLMRTMKAVSLTVPTPGHEVRLVDVPLPESKPGWVLVKVRAFGLNHSEKLLRLSEIQSPHINKPIIPGIECAGEIADPSDSPFHVGQVVIALMGGMGRSFNGSHAEYALLPTHHVFTVDSRFSWEQLAPFPETYYTAYGSLIDCLQLEPSDRLLVRGATCALGYAAIQIAGAIGCEVIATTHREEKRHLLQLAGVHEVLLDTGELAGSVSDISKVLELVGARTLRDTMRCVEAGGIVCHTGVLGGEYVLNRFDPIKEIPNGGFLTGFYSNHPTQLQVDRILKFLGLHQIAPLIGRVFPFSRINEAYGALDAGSVNGKIVVTVTSHE